MKRANNAYSANRHHAYQQGQIQKISTVLTGESWKSNQQPPFFHLWLVKLIPK